MRYTVNWTRSAVDQLTDVWINPTDRPEVTAASHRIERRLRVDPECEGEDFYGDRLLVDAPLAVTFTVYPDDLRVDLLQVQHV